MKRPPLILLTELEREIQTTKITSLEDFKDVVVRVHQEAVYPKLVKELGWNHNRAERMQLEFQDVLAEHSRDEWLEELDKVWLSYR